MLNKKNLIKKTYPNVEVRDIQIFHVKNVLVWDDKKMYRLFQGCDRNFYNGMIKMCCKLW